MVTEEDKDTVKKNSGWWGRRKYAEDRKQNGGNI